MKIMTVKSCHPDSTSCCACGKTIIMQVGYCAVSIEFDEDINPSMVKALNFHLRTNDKDIFVIDDTEPAKTDFEEYKNSF